MATINNEDLRNTFNYLATLEIIVNKEVRQINGNKYYLDKIVPEGIAKTYSQKDKTAKEFADNLKTPLFLLWLHLKGWFLQNTELLTEPLKMSLGTTQQNPWITLNQGKIL